MATGPRGHRSEQAPRIVLDPYQEQVASITQGCHAVYAGAGSGKTTTLVERTARRVEEGVPAGRVCVLVYNADAAETLRTRMKERLGKAQGGYVSIQTFHAWSYRWVKQALPGVRLLGERDGPSIYTTLMPILEKRNIEMPARDAERVMGAITERLLDPSDPESAKTLEKMFGGSRMDSRALLDAWRLFQAVKRQQRLIDFSDMLGSVACCLIGRNSPDSAVTLPPGLPDLIAGLYDHVSIDEAQDMNESRISITLFLAQFAKSTVWVGDVRQSINGWTGAQPEFFKGLCVNSDGIDPLASMLTLPVNRRSTATIVAAGNRIAQGTGWHTGGDVLVRDGVGDGVPIQVWHTPDPSEEVKRIVDDLRVRIAADGLISPTRQSNYAILARTNAWLINLEAGLIGAGIPCRMLNEEGGVWASQHGQEILAYLRAVEGIPDFGLLEVANKPKRFLSKKVLGMAVRAALTQVPVPGAAMVPKDYWALMKETEKTVKEGEGKMARGSSPAGLLVNDLRALAKLNWTARCEAIGELLISSMGTRGGAMLIAQEERAETYEVLCHLAGELGSLMGILAYQRQEVARAKEEGAVVLSSIHRSKGLEWPVVYLCGLNSRRLPHERAHDHDEERRLLYVAETRAQFVFIASTGGKPSPFLALLEDVPRGRGPS